MTFLISAKRPKIEAIQVNPFKVGIAIYDASGFQIIEFAEIGADDNGRGVHSIRRSVSLVLVFHVKGYFNWVFTVYLPWTLHVAFGWDGDINLVD